MTELELQAVLFAVFLLGAGVGGFVIASRAAELRTAIWSAGLWALLYVVLVFTIGLPE